MSDLLQTIQNTVAKEWFESKMPGVSKENQKFGLLVSYTQLDLWPEVCKRYAFEVAKASLMEASENAKAIIANGEHGMEYPYVSKGSITDESNIKL